MIKITTFLKRKPGMSAPEFSAYWRAGHGDLAKIVNDGRRYVQNHVLEDGYHSDSDPLWDGIPQVWYESTRAIKSQMQVPEYAQLRSDEANFVDPATMDFMFLDEQVIADHENCEQAVKVMLFLTRSPNMPGEDFQRAWLERQVPLTTKLPGLKRYVLGQAIYKLHSQQHPALYDGLEELWFEDIATAREALRSAHYANKAAGMEGLCEPFPAPCVIVKELLMCP